MKTQKQIKTQRMELPEDLECLVRGDVVEAIYQYEGRFFKEEELKLAFHSLSRGIQLQFVRPANDGHGDYIIRYGAMKGQLVLRDGKVVINEDLSFARSYTQRDPDYTELNKTLIMGGLREE